VANPHPNRLRREAIIPLPASSRLSFVLIASVLLVGFTSVMDVFLWGVFNAPIVERREAGRQYQLDSLRADYAELAAEAEQLRERGDALAAALMSCDDGTTAPQFATPCFHDEVEVRVADTGSVLCVPMVQLQAVSEPIVLGGGSP